MDDGRSAPAARLANAARALGACRDCGLCDSRGQVVFGAGAADARLLVVGDPPDPLADASGSPFAADAGQMLENMLVGVLGMQAGQAYVTNIVKCQPPAARGPSQAELTACAPVLHAQLAVVQPDVVLVMGDVAARALFGATGGVAAVRGQWRTLDVAGRTLPAMATFHPSYLQDRPGDKRLVFGDLKLVRARLEAAGRRPTTS